ncbi:MAG: FMN-binding protein [Sedimentibacter sp.]|uniref:FMN-binding protein n=1 Tax=Sedimentibacter sp. TaxID=1960295 RepID=UPI003157F6F7
MKNKKFYYAAAAVIILVVAVMLSQRSTASEEAQAVLSFYPHAGKAELVKDVSDELYISLNFPGVKRAYKIEGEIKAYVASCIGYGGPVDVLAAFDTNSDRLLGIRILNHKESLDYAEHIEREWFLERFRDVSADRLLNLVVLEKEKEEDIVQVTGATISSQAVVSAVNACIGAYNYHHGKLEMSRVPDVVPQEMLSKDINSFAINWDGGSVRIDTDEIKQYEQLEMDVTLINTTGTETDMHVKGPALRDVLKKEGIDLGDYAGIGVTGRDGYYTMIDKEKLDINDIVLCWEVDGKSLKDDEKPVRIAVPLELGPYWVKMVTNIDLYDEISPKEIEKVHMFDALTRSIEPYYYEYYGNRDKSIEVGKILKKFDMVDEKGFFTMGASDGLVKNETISMVRQRYFIKVEGENAPMNISPSFKLGMNVKNMTHFSTTKDAVIFPEKMKEVVRTKVIGIDEALLLEDVLLTAGMRWEEGQNFKAVCADTSVCDMTYGDMLDSYIVSKDGQVHLICNTREIVDDLLRIEK